MTPARLWKLLAGLLGGAVGLVVGYLGTTFLYVGLRTVVDPTFAPARAEEIPLVALVGSLLAGTLGAFLAVLAARVATGA